LNYFKLTCNYLVLVGFLV
jgi:hypothetical protein